MKGLVIDENGTKFIVSQERQGRGAPVGRRWGLPATCQANAGALVEYTEDHSTGLGPRLGQVTVLKDEAAELPLMLPAPDRNIVALKNVQSSSPPVRKAKAK